MHKKLLSQQRIQKKEKLYVISLIHCNEKKRHLGKDISFQNIMRLDSNLKYQCNISAWRIKSFVCAKAVKSNFLYLFALFIDRQIIQRYNQSSPNMSLFLIHYRILVYFNVGHFHFISCMFFNIYEFIHICDKDVQNDSRDRQWYTDDESFSRSDVMLLWEDIDK